MQREKELGEAEPVERRQSWRTLSLRNNLLLSKSLG